MSDKRGLSIDVGEAVEVELPADIAEAIAGVKDEQSALGYAWQPWQDAVLLKYWGKHFNETGVRKRDLIDKVLCQRGMPKMSDTTALKRYYELIAERDGKDDT